VRLRPLTEAECYARCYGDWPPDSVKVLPPAADEGAAAVGHEGREGRSDPVEKLEAA
jgi:hypothetical protein